jgi:hypothetical protein
MRKTVIPDNNNIENPSKKNLIRWIGNLLSILRIGYFGYYPWNEGSQVFGPRYGVG